MSDPINANRLIFGGTWEGKVGVEGGIPTTYTKSGSTINAYTGTAATINTALSNAADDTYVELGAGTFTLSTNIILSNSRTILRGQVDANGNPTTVLNIDGTEKVFIGQSVDWSTTTGWTRRTVSSPAPNAIRGVSTVTLSAVTGLVIDQVIFFTATGTGGDDAYAFGQLANQCWTHWARVTAISGNDVTFSPAFSADYLGAGATFECDYKAGLWMTRKCGLENVEINSPGSTIAVFIEMRCTDSCWLQNVKAGPTSGNGGAQHVEMYVSFRNEIRHCDLHGQTVYGNSSYAIKAFGVGALLVVNTIFEDLANVMPMFNVHGSAFAYNYINGLGYDSPNGWLSQIVYDHGGQDDYNLFEGNWCAASYNDDDAASQNTVWFRNRMRGFDDDASTGPTDQDTNCMSLEAGHLNRVLAGNVLGEVGYTDDYENIFTGTSDFPDKTVYNLRDSTVATFVKKANYNVVDAGINASEALTGGEVLVNSYLFSSKPSFFGFLDFPPCDPTDFTGSNTFTNYPAGYRAQNGFDPPGGGQSGIGTLAVDNLIIG